ncbi:MAG: tripartite tricarboxylate transporter TctB family protein [Beijerinckiaceae bacterium]
MRINERVLAIALLALSAFVIWQASSFPKLAGMTVGPGLFPTVLASALAIASILVLATSWKQTRATPLVTIDPDVRNRQSIIRAAAVFASCGLFAAFGKSLGFVIVGALSLGGLLLAFGLRWKLAAAITLILIITVDVFFVRVMRIPLPLGPLDFLGNWL